jgi:hypothetical protein
VRVFRDVLVQPIGRNEWIAISKEAGVEGETLMLGVPDLERCEAPHRFPVRVVESRPVIVDGEMRYRIRLHTGELLPPVLFEQQVRR